ncbi:methanol/ethanol family PQQ-dependent dehydrogenase [Candidatus Phyllobacterium onerii]|uniref:methanol/ethanol family PQQ-dependent dehydrogenase n=1 Tax=Candidatus Phyllobacterium onerii TaxID=3020828 RepID=UPI003A87C03D
MQEECFMRHKLFWLLVPISALFLFLNSLGAFAQQNASVHGESGEWPMPARDFASTRFSPLNEINSDNVDKLKVAFTFSLGVNRGQESSPIVIEDTLYVVTPYPNILYALDLKKPGAPLKWKYEPKTEAAAQGVACCDTVNRGPVYGDGRIYYNTLDGHTIAVDAQTGRELWNVRLGDINIGETMTMAPLFVNGRVLVGNSGGEFGVRGWIQALEAGSGKVLWKAWSTGPDKDVLIGPDFHPYYDMDKGKDLGVTSWPPDAWKQGGGNVWGWISYDPELNLIFHGTGNPGPWNADARPGDNKWTAGIFARDANTGEARWFYQWSPHDVYDHDGINEQILLDRDWHGKPRKLLIRPERNGYLYVMDRLTGEVLSATPFAPVNSSTGVDLKTGRLQMNPDKQPETGKVVRDICPAAPGAKDWNPSAYSPQTGYLYIPHNNVCMDLEGVEANYIAGTPFVGANVAMKAGPGDGHRGEYSAWDIDSGKATWTINERFPVWSGTVATAGNLVFYGNMEGWFKALDARTGKLLWQFKTGSGVIGQPTTYRGPDGHQYVAILSGVGGWSGAIAVLGLDGRDRTAGLGFVGAMQDLPSATTTGGMLYVFRLP